MNFWLTVGLFQAMHDVYYEMQNASYNRFLKISKRNSTAPPQISIVKQLEKSLAKSSMPKIIT